MLIEKIKTLSGFRRKTAEPVTEDDLRLQTSQRKMLLSLQGSHIAGAPGHVKAKRRARGKVAKQSRKTNRGR